MPTHTVLSLALITALCSASSFAQGQRAKSPITIGPETTVLTEPVDEAGYIDYVEAINRKLRKGVTPETNAAVPIRHLLQRSEIPPEREPEYFRLLGVTPAANNAPRMVTQVDIFNKYTGAERQQVVNELNTATSSPWKGEDLQVASDWIRQNDEAIALLREAVRRPHYYSPILSESGRLYDVLLPDTQNARSCARLLMADACYNLGNGHDAAALEDLLAAQRLAGHIGNGVTLIDVLVAIAIRGMAFRVEEHYLNVAKPNLARAKFWRAKLKTARSIKSTADCFTEAERYMFLDTVGAVAAGADIQALFGGAALIADEPVEPADPLRGAAQNLVRQRLLNARVDFDKLLKDGNKEYDRVTRLLRIEDPVRQAEEFAKFQADMKKRQDAAAKWGPAMLLLQGNQLGPHLRDMLLAALLPATEACRKAERQDMARRDIMNVAWALSAYHVDEKKWPNTLKQLVPKYLDGIPTDQFDGSPLRYAVRDHACVVYSVGRNGKDDGGLSIANDPGLSDIVVELRR